MALFIINPPEFFLLLLLLLLQTVFPLPLKQKFRTIKTVEENTERTADKSDRATDPSTRPRASTAAATLRFARTRIRTDAASVGTRLVFAFSSESLTLRVF